MVFVLWIISSPQRGLLPPGKLKKWKRKLVFIFTCQMVLSFLSFGVTFYSQSVLILLNQWQSVKLVSKFWFASFGIAKYPPPCWAKKRFAMIKPVIDIWIERDRRSIFHSRLKPINHTMGYLHIIDSSWRGWGRRDSEWIKNDLIAVQCMIRICQEK